MRFISARVMLMRLGWMAARRSGRISSVAGRGRGVSVGTICSPERGMG